MFARIQRLSVIVTRHGRLAGLGAALFAFVVFCTLGLGQIWARDDAIPSVHVLGSGSHLSMLITSDHSRLLIASGDDATAFGNALGRARHLTSRRIDVAILAGSEADTSVARYVRNNLHVRTFFVIDGPLAAHLGDLRLGPDDLIAKSTRIRLPGGVDVTITPESRQNGIWSALIQRGDTTILAGNWPAPSPTKWTAPSAVVFIDKFSLETLDRFSYPAIVFSSRVATPADLREAELRAGQSLYAVRVQPATTASLTFVDSGIRIDATTIKLGDTASS